MSADDITPGFLNSKNKERERERVNSATMTYFWPMGIPLLIVVL
jgi:hypothetical protein